MEKTQQFKTNINCGNCVRTVSGFLNEIEGINRWEVDTTSSDKILTVEGSVPAATIIAAVEEAGFDIVVDGRR
ncbi:MAG: heavy-metal-associated domain-containing protein [Saprospiraceae bacterium]|nr:heavy-metal-associated domain-containing protein [Saprospiraceae bacterium]